MAVDLSDLIPTLRREIEPRVRIYFRLQPMTTGLASYRILSGKPSCSGSSTISQSQTVWYLPLREPRT